MAKQKEPSKAELDEMWDFGQYVSWMLEHNKKPEANKDKLYKAETKKLAGKKKKESAK